MNVITRISRVAASLFVFWTVGASGAAAQEVVPPPLRSARQPSRVSYSRDIQPLLANYCYKCHGPDEQNRQGELRLDQPAPALNKLASGKTAVVPRRPDQSQLWLRVNSRDGDLKMPPPDFGKQLNRLQREQLRRWIEEGAEWPGHWAYSAPVRPRLPSVRRREWPRGAIDRFSLAAMERRGRKPSAEASRRTLLRRVTLDLTGLPPTPREMRRFLSDRSPRAYENAVERLLESPRFGERMALHWLDLARYADTHGYHTDSHRDVWRWRQWVIEAFNRNLPFDQFTIEQLAGDLLKRPTLEQLIATGFNRNNMVNFEAGALEEEYQTEYVIDRVQTTATVWLGQTFQCARCHDHKYDPISQRDFYRFYAYFNRLPEKGLDGNKGNAVPFIAAPTAEQVRRETLLTQRMLSLDEALTRRARECDSDLRRWELSLRSGEQKVPGPPADAAAYYRFENDKNAAHDETSHARHGRVVGAPLVLPDKFGKALLFTGNVHLDLGDQVGDVAPKEAWSFTAWLMPTAKQQMIVWERFDAKLQRGLRLSVSSDRVELLLQHLEGQAIHVRSAGSILQNEWQHLAVTYDGSSKAAGVSIVLNGSPARTEVVRDNLTSSFKVADPTRIGGLQQQLPFRGMMDEIRFYRRRLATREVSHLAQGLPVAAILAVAAAERTPKQLRELKQYFLRQVDSKAIQLHAERNAVDKLRQALQREVPTTMVMQEMKVPRPTRILQRGNYQFPLSEVQPGTPASLPQLGQFAPNRLGLARWLTDRRHPLTSRVAVNRFWQMFYGTGLVRTPEDFGTRGEPPTHPELLDWLAVEFVESGWDVKRIVRLMVTSATYRQSSRQTAWHQQHDPNNLWLTRASRVRLPAEHIRDGALAVSGLLQERLGGISVHPYQPLGLWKEVSFNPRDYTAQIYTQGNGSALYRRSMYTFWKRAVPPPSLVAFDAPDRETCTVKRSRSNSPLQALVLMNDPTYVEASRVLAERLMERQTDPQSLIKAAFERCLARPPRDAEMQLLLHIFKAQLADYRARPQLAHDLLRVGESPVNSQLPVVEVAAWATTLNVILCSDEMINRP